MRADVFDDGNSIQQAGPSISSLLPGLLDGNVKRKSGLTTANRLATSGTAAGTRRGVGIRKPAVPRLRQGTTTTSTQQHPPASTRPYSAGIVTTATASNNPARMSYVAAVACNSIPEEYLNMLEASAPISTAGFTSVQSVEPLTTPGPSRGVEERPEPPRTVVRPVQTSPRNLPQAVVPPMPAVEVEDVEMGSMEKPTRTVSSARHHHVPVSSRVVWHNGLPLPVVDGPEQENCPPLNDVSMRDVTTSDIKPQSTEVLRNFQPTKRPITEVGIGDDHDDDNTRTRVITTPIGDLSAGGENIVSLRKAIEERENNDSNDEADQEDGEATVDAAVGSRESGKRTKFTLRRSIMERFQRCGIDFNTFAPP
ncbi:unnamed protein product [Hymenolepis diminuta]|nr:unnamed protein product [Hymenolepis diminuta]